MRRVRNEAVKAMEKALRAVHAGGPLKSLCYPRLSAASFAMQLLMPSSAAETAGQRTAAGCPFLSVSFT